jgi:hypothetical protein
MFPLTVEPSSRTALDRSEFELEASIGLVEANPDSMPMPLSARAILAPSMIRTMRRRNANTITPDM